MKYKFPLTTLIFTLSLIINAYSQTWYSRANGNWNAIASWSATSGGPAGASVPVAGDTVVIERGFDITVTGTQECDTLTINGAALIINGGSLTVSSGMYVDGNFGKDSKFTMTGGTATFNGDVTCFSDEKNGKIAL